MSDPSRLLVTAASGQLGRLVVERLLETVAAAQIAVTTRDQEAAARASARGLHAHVADYAEAATLDAAFRGIERLLMISSSAIGGRAVQHSNVIAAAARAGVRQLVYTSVLHAETPGFALGEEHRRTEAEIRASGIPFVLLRNGWYTENLTAFIPAALAHGVHLGAAGEARFSTAARADYAAAAAAVLTAAEDRSGRVYELAGDEAFTLSEFAAEVARRSGKPIAYRNMPEADFRAALLGAGLPEDLATMLANADTAAAKGALFDDTHQLSRLIARPTTPWQATVAAALGQSRPAAA